MSPQHRVAAGEAGATATDDRLVDLALGLLPASTVSLASELSGVDPDALSFEAWQALTELEALLDPDSPWAVRVRSLRRRSHYATTLAAAKAAQLSAAFSSAGIAHAVFGDLAMATAYGLAPGGHPMNFLAVWTDPDVPLADLERALRTVEGLRTARGRGQLVRASFGGLAIGIHRGWRPPLGRGRGDLRRPPVRMMDLPTDPFPVVAPHLEAYLTMIGSRHFEASAWLLDLRTIAAANPEFWSQLPSVAAAAGRSTTLGDAWEEARRRNVAPPVPRLHPDPPRAQLSQRITRMNRTARGRMVPLIGEAAARPDHGPWPAMYDTALKVTARYVGAQLTTIDEGGAALMADIRPVILAANHQDHLDYDTILMATPKARRRRLRYVATEQVLATFGSGQGIVGRARAAMMRGIYTHIHRVIPIREHIRGRAAVTAMVDALAAGDTVVIFPEGVRNAEPGLARLKRGVAVLALETGVPILPVRIDGTSGKLPVRRGRLVRAKPRITVRFRAPIQVAAQEDPRDVLARLARALSPDGGQPTAGGDSS